MADATAPAVAAAAGPMLSRGHVRGIALAIVVFVGVLATYTFLLLGRPIFWRLWSEYAARAPASSGGAAGAAAATKAVGAALRRLAQQHRRMRGGGGGGGGGGFGGGGGV